MKLLIVSHACATPVNQKFFAAVEQISGWSLSLVAPREWRDDYGTVRELTRWPSFQGRLYPVPVWGSGNVPLHVYRSSFRSLLRTIEPDAIYVHHEPYAAATAQIYTANRLWHGCPIGFFTWQNLKKAYPPPFRQTERMVFRQSAFACAGSESAISVLRAKGYEAPATLLPGTVDPSLYRPDPSAQDLRAELKLPPEAPILGFMGRILPVKGLFTLLHALADLRALSWHLVLVGSGTAEDALRTLAVDLGLADRIHFTGYVPHSDAPRYLSLFDVLVLPSETQPSWKEQFGRVLIEALACGTPLVGSTSGEIPHVIARTEGGLTFPEGNTAALSQALRRMITEPELRTRFARNGRGNVLREYTEEVLARRFIDTIQSTCGHRSQPPVPTLAP